jgi:hypothetical protein
MSTLGQKSMVHGSKLQMANLIRGGGNLVFYYDDFPGSVWDFEIINFGSSFFNVQEYIYIKSDYLHICVCFKISIHLGMLVFMFWTVET